MAAGQAKGRRTTLCVLLLLAVLVILFGVSVALTYLGGGGHGLVKIF